MNLEPIIDLVENTQAPYLHYARKVMTAKERKRLLQLLPDDRIVFMDGAKMQTVPGCTHEVGTELGVYVPPGAGFATFENFIRGVVDGCWGADDKAINLLIIIENSDRVLCRAKEETREPMTKEEFMGALAAAGPYAARTGHYARSKRRPVGYNVIFLFDPKNKKIDVGSANHLKL